MSFQVPKGAIVLLPLLTLTWVCKIGCAKSSGAIILQKKNPNALGSTFLISPKNLNHDMKLIMKI